jgi:hypothetical protein
MRRIRRVVTLALAGTLVAAVGPASIASAAPPSTAQCAKAWHEWQYFSIAPGFPTTLSPKERNRIVKQCKQAGRLPNYDTQVKLTQKAFNVTAQILEREIRRVSTATGLHPCEVISQVLKPVGKYGKPIGGEGGRDVEGYAPDSFLPILKFNWYGGPFRLKYGVGCENEASASLWFVADPYPPSDSHPARYPSDAEVKKDPWPRTPVEGAMSTCITWGTRLGNDEVGGEGFIFGFLWSRVNLPNDVGSCYPRALGLDGLGKYPFKQVPNLPL